MLTSLLIRNYAVIDELSIDPTGGLVVLTGETGAGKSIIIDALSLLLGERASSDNIRSGASKAVVEGVFFVGQNPAIRALLEDNGLEATENLRLYREVPTKGTSRCLMNDTPVPLSVLKQAGDLLVDLHGQHEHQSLLQPRTHVEILDAFGGLEEAVKDYHATYMKLGEMVAKLSALRNQEQQLKEMRDFRSFQLKEISDVDPRPGEEEGLLTEIRVLENLEKVLRDTTDAYELLYGGDRSAYELLSETHDRLKSLAEIDKQFEGAADEIESARAIIGELARFVQEYRSGNEFHAERLEELQNRLGRLGLLKKKYGGTIENVIAFREKVQAELQLVENAEEIAESLTQDIETFRVECGRQAQQISVKRREASQRVEREVVRELKTLGIANASFSAHIQQTEYVSGDKSGPVAEFATAGKKRLKLDARGFDEVEFLISTNLGEETRPLVRVASGGEISRIMLALKSVLAKQDRVPVMVFDEIDVGVSGSVARAVGMNLKKLSRSHQVIVITHLPQIAGLADVHYTVYKTEHDGRAETCAKLLLPEERVHEVARLLSGSRITEAALMGARELTGIS
jgi:DNA repair protein RecN (Recombination protein N)